jgi:long-subunit fatty acid transport protein
MDNTQPNNDTQPINTIFNFNNIEYIDKDDALHVVSIISNKTIVDNYNLSLTIGYTINEKVSITGGLLINNKKCELKYTYKNKNIFVIKNDSELMVIKLNRNFKYIGETVIISQQNKDNLKYQQSNIMVFTTKNVSFYNFDDRNIKFNVK